MIDVMDNLSKLLYVAERDIDLLLLEELNVCRDFASWFLRQIRQQSDDVTPLRGAWHSVTDAELGESDLIVLYDDDFAILVENKIDAPAQPEQGQRYKLRGSKGQEKGDWKDYLTCIVAPRRYLEINAETQHYDSTLSYESIRQWFKALGTSRGDYRSQMIDAAIEQNRRGYSPVVDEDVSQFWLSYWRLASELFPMLEMSKPGPKPANSDWPDFRPKALAKNLNIVHKMAQGYVDLQVRDAADDLERIRLMVDDPLIKVVSAGKSAAVRFEVRPVDRFGSFEAQQDHVVLALEAASKLYTIAEGMRNDI